MIWRIHQHLYLHVQCFFKRDVGLEVWRIAAPAVSLRWLPDWDRKDCHGAVIWKVSNPTRCWTLDVAGSGKCEGCVLLDVCIHFEDIDVEMKAAVTFISCTVPHFTYFTTTKRRSGEFQSCFVQSFPVGPSWSILISALHDAMQGQCEWLQSIWEFQVAHALGWSWLVWGRFVESVDGLKSTVVADDGSIQLRIP